MYCHACGLELIEGGQFCQSCGTKVLQIGKDTKAQGATTNHQTSSAYAQSIGAVVGEIALIPHVSILFRSESEEMEPPWKDGTVDLLVTENALIFYPTHRSHLLKKSVVQARKYAMPIGQFLLAGAGPIGVGVGTVLGAGVEAIAIMASKGNDAINGPNEKLVDDLPFEQAVVCLKQEIEVKTYAVKGKGWLATSKLELAIEGKIHLPKDVVREVTVLPVYNGSDSYAKLLKGAGYLADASSINCSETEYVERIRSRYPHPRLMTDEERLKRLEQVCSQMREEGKI
jgi:hypothetical protein